MRPLGSMRVLELGQYISAPYCALMLADQGAEVVKLERPAVGDPRRSYDPMVVGDGGSLSGGFVSYNRNKKSLALDLRNPTDRDAFLALLPQFDVVVENLRPGAMDRLGLSWELLQQHHPGLVYCAISGFGRAASRRGRFADRPAFDTPVQAIGGLMGVTGEAGGPPLPTVTGFADIYTGVHAAFAVLSALEGRRLTGRGAFVDVSMYDCVSSLMERELMLYEFTGERRPRGVDRFAPVGSLRAKDGYVALILPTDEMWRRLCVAIDRPDLLEDPRLATVLQRSEMFAAVIRPEAEAWTRHRARTEIVERFAAVGLPAGEVQEIEELAACDHLEAREMFMTVVDEHTGPHRLIRTPVVIDGFESPSTRSAPALGADTVDLLASVGIDPTAVYQES